MKTIKSTADHLRSFLCKLLAHGESAYSSKKKKNIKTFDKKAESFSSIILKASLRTATHYIRKRFILIFMTFCLIRCSQYM